MCLLNYIVALCYWVGLHRYQMTSLKSFPNLASCCAVLLPIHLRQVDFQSNPTQLLHFVFLRTCKCFTYYLATDLQVLTRNALRDVSQNPPLCQLLRRATPDPRLEKMATLVDKLKAAMLERLTMTQNEEEDRIMYIRKANQKRKETLQQCEKLEKELTIAQEQRAAEANKRSETIRQLKSDLHQIEQFAEESARRVKSEIEKVTSTHGFCFFDTFFTLATTI